MYLLNHRHENPKEVVKSTGRILGNVFKFLIHQSKFLAILNLKKKMAFFIFPWCLKAYFRFGCVEYPLEEIHLKINM